MKLERIVLVLLQLMYVVAGNAMQEECRLTEIHPPVIVMATDNGYAIPTAVSIMSLKNTTPGNKKVIVLSHKMSDQNKSAMEALSDKTTKVVVEEIPEQYIEMARPYSTNWNILVQVRIFYQELFNSLNENQEFLNRLGFNNDKIHYFIHLDSDTIVVRNPFPMLDEVYSNSCFASTNLHFLSSSLLQHEVANADHSQTVFTGVSGGVVLWNLDNINSHERSVVMSAEEAKRQSMLETFYNNDKSYRMWNSLCNAPDWNDISNIMHKLKLHRLDELKEYHSLSEYTEIGDEGTKVAIDNFMRNFLELSNTFASVISDKITEIFEYYIEEAKPINREKSVCPCVKNLDVILHNPTEEEVILNFDNVFSSLEPKYNFILKYVFPEIDCSPEDSFAYVRRQIPDIKNYRDIVKKLLNKHPELINEIDSNFKNMAIMHFDVCYKPWKKEFAELAEQIPQLKIIEQIYGSYVDQLTGFKDLKKTGYPPLTAGAIQKLLDTIKPADRLRELQR